MFRCRLNFDTSWRVLHRSSHSKKPRNTKPPNHQGTGMFCSNLSKHCSSWDVSQVRNSSNSHRTSVDGNCNRGLISIFSIQTSFEGFSPSWSPSPITTLNGREWLQGSPTCATRLVWRSCPASIIVPPLPAASHTDHTSQPASKWAVSKVQTRGQNFLVCYHKQEISHVLLVPLFCSPCSCSCSRPGPDQTPRLSGSPQHCTALTYTRRTQTPVLSSENPGKAAWTCKCYHFSVATLEKKREKLERGSRAACTAREKCDARWTLTPSGNVNSAAVSTTGTETGTVNRAFVVWNQLNTRLARTQLRLRDHDHDPNACWRRWRRWEIAIVQLSNRSGPMSRFRVQRIDASDFPVDLDAQPVLPSRLLFLLWTKMSRVGCKVFWTTTTGRRGMRGRNFEPQSDQRGAIAAHPFAYTLHRCKIHQSFWKKKRVPEAAIGLFDPWDFNAQCRPPLLHLHTIFISSHHRLFPKRLLLGIWTLQGFRDASGLVLIFCLPCTSREPGGRARAARGQLHSTGNGWAMDGHCPGYPYQGHWKPFL